MQLQEVWHTILDALNLSFSYLTNPEKRTFSFYLLSSALLALLPFYKSKTSKNFLLYLFPKKLWLSKSSKIDGLLIVFNGFIKTLIIAPYLYLGLHLAYYTNEFLITSFGFSKITLGIYQTLFLYTLCITLFNDFFSYVIHTMMHKLPFLWEFHKTHHSARYMTPFTQYRIHPIELLINNARGIILFGLITGLFDYLSQHQVNKLMFLGVNVFGFVFMFFGANLRHSHVKLTYPHWLEKIIISPFQHQIHHSIEKKHYNKNMGSKLAIWDFLFGTIAYSRGEGNLRFGINRTDKEFNSFWGNLFYPFKNVVLMIFRK
jgi:sterol desaturase/sphingolipid hydroxylase (fatty acid hydroxylase superfamily)